MSDRRTLILAHPEARRRAMSAVAEAPAGFVVTIAAPTRSLAASARFHAICSDLEASRFPWFGHPRVAAEWKVLLISGHATVTKAGAMVVPGIEGEMVNIRESSALMSKARSASLIEYSEAFCIANEVPLRDPMSAEVA